jgi:crotonobetainyl-CoA:carnitine CoA-transferase CaiB-like acyl-CoA transferase
MTASDFGGSRTDEMGVGALDGIVIADFSRVLAGPYCSMLLADMGATVIKVESPQGDETRAWTPPVHGEESTYYLSLNRGKRSIVLDFRDREDLAVARGIAARADVMLENFKPGGLAKFGLDYDSIATTNPGVVYASISGFGADEGAHLRGYDLLVQASSGLMSLTGSADGPPMRAGVAVIDVITGLHTALAILAALHSRRETGLGQRVQTNLMSSALSGLVNQTGAYAMSGMVSSRMGNEHPSLYPYEPMPTATQDVIIAVGNDRQFHALCNVLDTGELADDARFITVAARNANREELRKQLRSRLAMRGADDWFSLLSAAGVPCAPINDIGQGVRLAERLGLDPIVNVGHGSRALPGIAHPIRFSSSTVTYDIAPPEMNADAGEIRAWLAGEPLRSTIAAASDAP